MDGRRMTIRMRTIDRSLHALFACVLYLTILFLWQRSYARSCTALVFPALTFLAIFGGLLARRLERKRFAIDYYLDRRSSLRGLLRGALPSVAISLAAAVPLAGFLVAFAALSRPTDWIFFCAVTIAAPLLFNACSAWPGCHFRRETPDGGRRAAVADVLVARLTGTLLLVVLAAVYIYASYDLIPAPGEKIFHASIERTLEAFSARGRSSCPVVQDVLFAATQVEGLSWYFVTTAVVLPWLHDMLRPLLWGGFFLRTAMVFGGFIRGLEGSILLACWIAEQRCRKE